MRVMDLPGWPPQSAGAFNLRSDRFPTSADQVTIEQVVAPLGDDLIFTCRFEGRFVFYNFPMLDRKTREKIVAILFENAGKTLMSIGTIEIPKDEGQAVAMLLQLVTPDLSMF